MELQVIMAWAYGFLEVFRWMIIWIGLGCGIQLVFSKSVTTVFVYWLLVHMNKKCFKEEKDGRKQMRNEG